MSALFDAEDYERHDPAWGSGPRPLWMFSANKRAKIELLADAPTAPPKWLSLGPSGGAQIISRAWCEWHWRRGSDPLSKTARDFISAALRAAVLERDGSTCQLCGGDVEPDDVHLDHRMPVSRGGKTTLDNLQVTHSVCNLRKGARLPEEAEV